MKIAFVSWEFPPAFGGGIGTYVAAMSRILAQRGHDVCVITVTDAKYPLRECVDGLQIIRLPLTGAAGAEPMATLRCWQARADAVAELLGRMRDLDVIEFADYRGEGVAYLAATPPSQRPACVVRLHTALNVLNKYNASRVRYPVLESFEDQGLISADHLVSPSAALAREAHSFLPQLGAIEILAYPTDPAFLQRDLEPDITTDQILYVGRLEERKGVETLVRAAPAVLQSCPGAVLHLVGGDTQVSAAVPSMRERLNGLIPREFASRIVFTGAIPREELVAHYRRARVCVFPSLFENFPNTCLEAMSLGRPVIGTDNSGMAEMIEDGVSGRIARAGDVEHLAEVLIDLYNQPADKRQAMGCAARQRMRDLYHPDVIAEQYEKLFERFIQQSQARRGDEGGLARPVSTGDSPWRAGSRSPKDSPAGSRSHMPSAKPRVAVVIPCYNHGKYIRETLKSIDGQDWPNAEVVVVDDGSTDRETIDILDGLKRAGTRVIRQENQGLSAARNTGVRASDAPFYVAVDADDRIAPTFISKLIAPLLKDMSLGYCYSHVEFFGAASGVWACEPYDPRKLIVQNLSVATAVVRRAAFDLVGGYSRDMVHGFEDWDFWLALLSAGYHGRCVPEPLFYYRKHPPGVSMLDKTQQRRAEMVRQMVIHYRALFTSLLEVSIPDKDAMFFQAHMEAFANREALAAVAAQSGSGVLPQDPLYQELMAKAQLDHIENSGAWRMVQRLKHAAPYRWLANWRYGPDWQQHARHGTPAERLAHICNSRSYRLIQAVKRTPLHRWYARRKYGPQQQHP